MVGDRLTGAVDDRRAGRVGQGGGSAGVQRVGVETATAWKHNDGHCEDAEYDLLVEM